MNQSVLVKRPVAFRLPRMDSATAGQTLSATEWRYFTDEAEAYREAEALGIDYQALFVRDGTVITLTEAEVLEAAINRMGWPEIHAFNDERRRGQDIYEDAGGFWMRAIRRLFGLPSPYSEIETYQQAARRMVAEASAVGSHEEKSHD
ncbi:hypothetical protein AB8B21_05500 [Tardiphaga sp. 866_E4_N2_1]|uniref:hypothetical protein n=1 Tax=unclassified Tardiphaga TaxID=2631404 RepID=UPI003F239BA2